MNGVSRFNLIAFICNRREAISRASGLDSTMVQKYKIFVNDVPLLISDKPPGRQIEEGKLIVPFTKPSDLLYTLDMLESGRSVKGAVLYSAALEDIEREMDKLFTKYTAAGGVVKNSKGELLMIFRRGYWDLPKGKQEEGEELRDTALRETTEETGVTDLRLQGEPYVTLHTYWDNDKPILKETHWYKMSATHTPGLSPQSSEGIEEVRWVKRHELPDLLDKSFGSIRDVLDNLLKPV